MNGDFDSHYFTHTYETRQDSPEGFVLEGDLTEAQSQAWPASRTWMLGHPFRYASEAQSYQDAWPSQDQTLITISDINAQDVEKWSADHSDQTVGGAWPLQGRAATIESEIDNQANMIRYGGGDWGVATAGFPMVDHIDPWHSVMVPVRGSANSGNAHSLQAYGDMDPNAEFNSSFGQPTGMRSLQDQMNQVAGMPTQYQAHRFASFKEDDSNSDRKRSRRKYEVSCANCSRTETLENFWLTQMNCTGRKICEFTPDRVPLPVLMLRPPSGTQEQRRSRPHLQSYRL